MSGVCPPPKGLMVPDEVIIQPASRPAIQSGDVIIQPGNVIIQPVFPDRVWSCNSCLILIGDWLIVTDDDKQVSCPLTGHIPISGGWVMTWFEVGCIIFHLNITWV